MNSNKIGKFLINELTMSIIEARFYKNASDKELVILFQKSIGNTVENVEIPNFLNDRPSHSLGRCFNIARKFCLISHHLIKSVDKIDNV